MLREFHALPTEARAREMKDRDYLWCLANGLLDREEELGLLCPDCRAKAEQAGALCAAGPRTRDSRGRAGAIPPLTWSGSAA